MLQNNQTVFPTAKINSYITIGLPNLQKQPAFLYAQSGAVYIIICVLLNVLPIPLPLMTNIV